MKFKGEHAQGTLALVGILLVVLGAIGAGIMFFDLSGDTNPEPINTTSLEYDIHSAVNEERENRGLEPLSFDDELQSVAAEYSQRMATEDFFAHTDPNGQTFQDRYEAAGYECNRKISETKRSQGGENLAYTTYGDPVRAEWGEVVEYQTQEELASGIVESWMRSPEHRENILSENWAMEGIGVYMTTDNVVYVTQNFC